MNKRKKPQKAKSTKYSDNRAHNKNDLSSKDIRKIGIPLICNAPWGTHFCQFYKTKEDLIDILVPYFKTGLENNEFCMWITSDPLRVDEAKKALSKKVKNLQKYIQKGQIEILDSSEWYTKSGRFDSDEVLSCWVKKEAWAREKGFDGLRLTGNTFWLEKKDWEDFTKYEEIINRVISKYHMIAICSYSLDKCNASEIIDVVSNHQFALIKKGRKWHRIESPKMKKVEEELQESKEKYRILFNSMTEGFVFGKTIYDDNGEPIDHIFLEANDAFYRQTGIKKEVILNKRVTEAIPGIREDPADWIRIYGKVAKTGKSVRFENYAKYEKKWYSLYVYSPKQDYFAVIFTDITERKKTEVQLRRTEVEIRTVFDNTPACLVLFDATPPYKVLVHNKCYQELFAEPFRSKGMFGLNVYEYAPDVESSGVIAVFDEVVRTKKPKSFLDFPYKSNPPNETWFNWYISPIIIDGKVVSLVSMSLDVTERHNAEAELENTQKLLTEGQKIAHLGIFEYDAVTKKTVWSEEECRIYGLAPGEPSPPYDEMLAKFIHPDDATLLHETFSKALRNGAIYKLEHRIVRPDGNIRFVYDRAHPYFDDTGKLIKYVGATLDITDRKNAEELLRMKEERLRLAQISSGAGLWDWDMNTGKLEWSDELFFLFGLDSEKTEANFDVWRSILHSDDKQMVEEKIQNAIDTHTSLTNEYRIILPTGDVRWINALGNTTYDLCDKPVRMTGICLDITERKKAEEALIQAKNEWERTFNSVPDLIAILDTKHRIIRANKAMAQRLGLPINQCVNLNCHLCVHGKNKPPKLCPHTMTLKDGEEHIAELYEEKLGGYFLVSTTPLFDSHGTLQGSVHVARDITDRKHFEEALQKSENRLNRAQEIAHLGSWENDLAHNHLIWSDETYRIFGLLPQELDVTYETFLEFVHPDDRAAVDAAYSDSLCEGRDTYEIEHRILRKNGKIRFVHEKCNHIRDKSGQIIRSLGMIHDITEKKQLNEKIRHLASFPQLNPSPVLEVNQSGEIIYQNPTTQMLFPDLADRSSNHPFLFDWKQVVKDLKKNNWSKTIIREIAIDQCNYQQIISPYEENKIRIYAVDITKRKQMEESLRKSEEKYRNIVENTTNLIMVTQPDGIISYLSPSCSQVIGYNPEELVGTNPIIFHPDDIKKIQQLLSQALNGEKGSGLEYRILTKQGNIKWVSHAWSPIFFNTKLQSIVSVVEDITQRKEIETNIKVLNQNLLHKANELAAANKELESFSYSVSHDLRAPLRSINGFSQALLEDYVDKLDKQGKEYLHRVQNATKRMEQLIDDMLRLSRLTRTEMTIETVDLGKIANTVINELKKNEPSRKYNFKTQKNILADGDANLLNILIENLLGNAWKFAKKRTQTEIEFGKKQQDKETVFFIRDNGAGFNMKYADKLFIPFQRLHDDAEYPGTGIGLGIVARIVNRHGGRIWAESDENKGTTFFFTLGGKNNE